MILELIIISNSDFGATWSKLERWHAASPMQSRITVRCKSTIFESNERGDDVVGNVKALATLYAYLILVLRKGCSLPINNLFNVGRKV